MEFSRRTTTKKEKETILSIFKSGDAIGKNNNELIKFISTKLLTIQSNWSDERISKWLANNKTLIADFLSKEISQKPEQPDEKRHGFPKIYSDGFNKYVFSDCHIKANGDLSGYYKCICCSEHVIIIKNSTGMFLARPHACTNVLNHKVEIEIQNLHNQLLVKAEKLLNENPGIGAKELYARVTNRKEKGYEKRELALDKKDIANLINAHNKIKCTIDQFITPAAQLFKFGGKEVNFLFFHQGAPFHFIAFSSKEQVTQFRRGRKIFIDGTFRETPIEFTDGQLLNILVLHEETHIFLPVMHILMQSKTEEAYDILFRLIKVYTDFPKVEFVMSDFEDALQNACRHHFGTDKVTGCFFHYAKAIRMKIDQLYYSNEATAALVDFFKELPFIDIENRNALFQYLTDLKNNELNHFLLYYRYQWLNNDTLNYEKDDIKTNNGCESFHSELSAKFQFDHPRIEALSSALWDLYTSKKSDIERLTKDIDKVKEGDNYEPSEVETIVGRAEYLINTLDKCKLVLREKRKNADISKVFPKRVDEIELKYTGNLILVSSDSD